MRPYEVMIIFDADLDEEIIRSAVDRSVQLIESKGAEKGQIDFWGKRRFAYEVKHRWEGYYVVLQAKAEPAAMDELHRVLSLADEVIRHSGLPSSAVSVGLLSLEMKRLVKQLPGKLFVRNR